MARVLSFIWEGTSARLAARSWDLDHWGTVRRGRKARHIWDLCWQGENQSIVDPDNWPDLSRCRLCEHPSYGLTHIICDRPLFTYLRGGVHHDLVHFAAREPSAPAARLLHRYVQLLFTHPGHEQRGHLWLGHWPPPLRQEFGPLLLPLSLREGQAALLRIGARITQAFLRGGPCSDYAPPSGH